MNKKQEDQIQFFSQKKYENRTKQTDLLLLSTLRNDPWIVLQNWVIDSSMLQEIFTSKCLSCIDGEKTELR